MNDLTGHFSRMEIVDSGRRRRFTDEAKLAIVAESYNGPRQVTATAQRHGITRWQLNAWRRAAREGRLVHRSTNGFVPAIVVAEPVVANTPPAATVAVPPPVSDHGRMEVVSANDRRVIVGRDVDVDVLLRIMRGLETLR
ncbi:Putative insertion sequence-related protein [Neorhizobium galegae bv. orientalis]|nr:Putative transposase number 1 for insertion sequence NGRIS-16a [Neorhizobium galegae bv. orientalis str. HAMBI 540]CDN51736.1 Putative transposase number 1 for insertion sequence NGRIS-16a [Neorhizobium galegae bv. orientalis str. HAMBI 540]CDZ55708.1 Putative insertion sequence-related protein [Neorhizobium galegae bv. orientalis]